MRICDPIIAHQRFTNGFFYTIGQQLDHSQTQQVQAGDQERMNFFLDHWPDLYTWLLLNISEENWSLYHRGMYPDMWFVLAIDFDHNTSLFNQAFADKIIIYSNQEQIL